MEGQSTESIRDTCLRLAGIYRSPYNAIPNLHVPFIIRSNFIILISEDLALYLGVLTVVRKFDTVSLK